MSIADLSDPTGVQSTTPNFEELTNFNRMTASSFVSLLGQVREWLGGVRDSDLIAGFDMPFVSETLDGVFDLADAFGDTLLFDDLNLEDRGVNGLQVLGYGTQANNDDGIVTGTSAPTVLDQSGSALVEFVVVNDAVNGGDPTVIDITVPASTTMGGLVSLINTRLGALAPGITASNSNGNLRFTAAAGALGVSSGIEKLTDADGKATFSTTQELADKLLELFGLSGVAYDADSNELTYKIDLSATLFTLDVPANFGIDLGPIGNIGTLGDPIIELGGTVGFNMTIGVDLGEADSSKAVTGSTNLVDLTGIDSLGDVIKNENAITATPASGNLSPNVAVTFDGADLEGNPNLAFAGMTITRSANADSGAGTGSWIDDGFRVGQTLEITDSSDNNGVYTVAGVTATVLTLTTAVDAESGNGIGVRAFNTVTRASGTWAADGFVQGQAVSISRSAAGNNGNFIIRSVVGDTITLEQADDFTREVGATGIKVMGGAVVRLPADATLTIAAPLLAGSPFTVTVLAAHDDDTPFVTDTSDNKTLLNLASDVNSALAEAGLASHFFASTAGTRLVLTARVQAADEPELTFNASESTLTRDEGSWLTDGFVVGQKISVDGSTHNDGTFTIVAVTESTITLDRAPTVEAGDEIKVTGTFDFTLQADATAQSSLGLPAGPTAGGTDDLIVTGADGTSYSVTLDGATTVQDVIDAVQAELGAAVTIEIDPSSKDRFVLRQTPAMTGDPRVVFTHNVGSGDTIVRTGPAGIGASGSWLDDGFAPGQEIRIAGTNDNNGTFTIDTVTADTITLVGSDVLVDAIDARDVGITTSGTDTFRIDPTNGSPSANALGILRSDATSDLTGDGIIDYRDVNGIISGAVIGGTSLLDRFFIRETELTGSLSLGSKGAQDIVVAGDFGYVQVLASGQPDFLGTVSVGISEDKLTLSKLIEGLSDISSLIDTPSIGGPEMDGKPQLTFATNEGSPDTITRASGSWLDDDFVTGKRVLIEGTESNDGSYVVTNVTATVLTLAADEELTAETADGARVYGEIGTFEMDISIEPDMNGLIDAAGGLPGLRVTLFNLGNPIGTTYQAAEGLMHTGESTFTLTDDLTSDIHKGDTVQATIGSDTVNTVVKEVSFSDSKTTVTVEADSLTSELNTVKIRRPAAIEYDFPGLGDLSKFQNLGITEIIDGLIALSDFLGQFESFGFLATPMPVVNVSFNDVLAFADELDDARQQFEENPSSAIQGLEDQLLQALGLPTAPSMASATGLIFSAGPGANTITRDDGSFVEEGFTDGMTITVAGLTDNRGTFTIASVTATTITLVENALVDEGGVGTEVFGAAIRGEAEGIFGVDLSLVPAQGAASDGPTMTDTVSFAANGAGPATITRASGSWLDDGFEPGQAIVVAGSASNNGAYNLGSMVADVTDTVITLKSSDALTNEANAANVTVSTGVDLLRIELNLGKSFNESLSLDFDLGDAGILTGSAGLRATGGANFKLAFGIDLGSPTDVYLFEDTAITASFQAGADDIDLRAVVGPFGATITDGSLTIGGGPAGSLPGTEILRAGLDFDGMAGTDSGVRLISDVLSNISGNFSGALEGEIHVELPVNFPTPSKPAGTIFYDAVLKVDSNTGALMVTGSDGTGDPELRVQNPQGSFVDGDGAPLTVGDIFTFDPSQFSLIDNILLVTDGVDLFLGGLQDVLDGEVFGIDLPLIGNQLSDGARFIEDMRNGFLKDFRDAVESAADPSGNLISELLFDLLGSNRNALVTDINESLAAAGLSGRVEAQATSEVERDMETGEVTGVTSRVWLIVTDPTVDSIAVTAADGSVAAVELGFGTEQEMLRDAEEYGISGIVMSDIGLLTGDAIFAVRLDDEAPVQVIVSEAVTLTNQRVLAAQGVALGLLLDENGEPAKSPADVRLMTNVDEPGIEFKDSFMQWNVKLGQQLLSKAADISLDIGVPGLALETDGQIRLDIDWELDFGFGINGTDAFYLDVSNENELEVNIDVTLPDASLRGELFFLEMTATPTSDSHLSASFGIDLKKKDSDAPIIGIGQLGMLRMEAGIHAEAILDLPLTLQVNKNFIPPAVASVFPTVLADFYLDWSLDDGDGGFVPLSQVGDAINDGLNLVAFNDVRLDLGEFISEFVAPVLEKVQSITRPIQPVIDILTSPLPVLSDLGPPMTIIDLAGTFGVINPALIYSIADIITLVNAIPTDTSGTIQIPFGNFAIIDRVNGLMPGASMEDIKEQNQATFDSYDPNSKVNETKPEDTGTDKKNKSFAKKLMASKSLSFPILTDPTQVFNLLMGEPATLVEYAIPPLEFDFSYTQFFPIAGPLGAAITGNFYALIDFHAIGFDTKGINDFAAGGFRNPLVIFDGFYVDDLDKSGKDVPELTFKGSLTATAELNLGIARGGAGGGIFAAVYFDLFDPDHDGRVRVNELIGNIANEIKYGTPAISPLAIFDVRGKVTARLFAFYELDLLVETIRKEFDITPPITLISFATDFFRPPALASTIEADGGGDVLQLNFGDFSDSRLNGTLTDIPENAVVTGDRSSLTVTSKIDGHTVTQTYTGNFERIIWTGGKGNDTLDLRGITADSGLTFDLDGGEGNDTILLSNNATGVAVIVGGDGDDTITGGGGADIIYGGAGNDIIRGGNGADFLFGDNGKVEDTDGDDVFDLRRAMALGTDGNDSIYGDAGADMLFGGGGNDYMEGGSGEDLLIGDAGIVSYDQPALTGAPALTFQHNQNAADKIIRATGRWSPELFTLQGNPVLTFSEAGGSITRGDTGSGGSFVADGFVAGQVIDITGTQDNNGQYTIQSVSAGSLVLVEATLTNETTNPILDNVGITTFEVPRFEAGRVIQVSGSGSNDGLYRIAAVSQDGKTLTLADTDELTQESAAGGHAIAITGSYQVQQTDRGLSFGNDVMLGNAGYDLMYGGNGDDQLDGGADDDMLFGQSGFNALFGGSGDDTLVGSTGSDYMHGYRPEYDAQVGETLTFVQANLTAGPTLTFADAGSADTITRSGGSWLTDGFVPGQRIRVTGTSSNNADYTIALVSGDGLTLTLSKMDRLSNETDSSVVVTANSLLRSIGSWTVDGFTAGENVTVSGSASNNRTFTVASVSGSGLRMELDPGVTLTAEGPTGSAAVLASQADGSDGAADGEDLLEGDAGADVMHGGDGADRLFGGRHADLMYGGAGNDILLGQNDADELHGGDDDDRLDGGAAADLMFGEDGDDTLVSELGDDRLRGGNDNDMYFIDFMGGTTQRVVDISDIGGLDDVTINGTDNADNFLIRANALNPQAGFVALLNTDMRYERLDFGREIENMTIAGKGGDDYFALDDVLVPTFIAGQLGNDRFQVGQLFKSERVTTVTTGIAAMDQFSTILTTQGWVSNGTSAATTLDGGDGADTFVVFHNREVLVTNGGAGDDNFIIKAFALDGSFEQTDQREKTEVSGNEGADTVQYAINAPVLIDGGDGLDTVTVIGTEFSDEFVVTEKGIFGAGLNVNFVNVEVVNVNGAEGDDSFFIRSSNVNVVTTISGGLGSDNFDVAPNALIEIISNDLLGHNGVISHTVASTDPRYDAIQIDGISTNVADNDEPAIRIDVPDGFTRVVEGSPAVLMGEHFAFDSYNVVLTREPKQDTTVRVIVIAPTSLVENPAPLTPAEALIAVPQLAFEVTSTATLFDNMTPVQVVSATAMELRFDSSNWDVPQTVKFTAVDDDRVEGVHFGQIRHQVVSEGAEQILGPGASGILILESNEQGNVNVQDTTDGKFAGDLKGAVLRITAGPGEGQERLVISNTGKVLTLNQPFDLEDGEEFGATSTYLLQTPNDSFIGAPGDLSLVSGSTYQDSGNTFPVTTAGVEDGLKGASIRITAGTAVGQERMIVNSTANGFTLDKPFVFRTVGGESTSIADAEVEYLIRRYDGTVLPAVTTRIEDNDAGTVIITESGDGTTVFEGVDPLTVAGGSDTYEVVLSKQPASNVTITLGNVDGQLDLFKVVGGNQVALTELVFTPANWSTPQVVSVAATNDPTSGNESGREGLHFGYISHTISGGGDDFANATAGLVTVQIGDDEIPSVIITESGGSTNVIEGSTAGPLSYRTDTYDVVLTAAPTSNVTVTVTPDATRSTRGVIAHNGVQVSVDQTTLTFTPANWNVPQTVTVTAVDDTFVDGGDTKVFAETSSIINRIKGPIYIDGLGEGISPDTTPLLFPGETNLLDSVGSVLAATDMTIDIDGAALGVVTLEQLQNATIEISRGLGVGQTRRATKAVPIGGGNYRLTLLTPWTTIPQPAVGEAAVEYGLRATDPNFLVDESVLVDVLTIYNVDSVADGGGTMDRVFDNALGIDRYRVRGWGMGPDLTSNGRTFDGGISYYNMETTTVHLGMGNDEVDVLATNIRLDDPATPEIDEEYQTVTILNTGLGDDDITVILDENKDGFFAVNAGGEIRRPTVESDDDIVDASLTSVNMYIFGGDGNDILMGGRGNDVIFGDLGRVDFKDGVTVITRVGVGTTPRDQTNGSVYLPTVITALSATVGGDDIITGGLGDDVIIGGRGNDTISGGGDRDVILGDHGQLTSTGDFKSPRFRTVADPLTLDAFGQPVVTDAAQRDPRTALGYEITLFDLSIDFPAEAFGDDTISGGASRDRLFGQLGDDVIHGDGSIDSNGNLVLAAQSTDAEDYIEGGGDNDMLYGGGGQDDLIGGSSSLYGLTTPALRPDGNDIIYGHSGTDSGATTADDADVIVGDNGNILRLVTIAANGVSTYVGFGGGATESTHVVPRIVQPLDSTLGGNIGDIGGDDTLFGEAGPDVIFTLAGNNTASGGSGVDLFHVGSLGTQVLTGGAGQDLVNLLGASGTYVVQRVDSHAQITTPNGLHTYDAMEHISISEISAASDTHVTVRDFTGTGVESIGIGPWVTRVGSDLLGRSGAFIGTLIVEGNDVSNQMFVRNEAFLIDDLVTGPTVVTEWGRVGISPATLPAALVVKGLDGNDQLIVSDAQTFPITLDGGAGDDLLVGSTGNEVLDGSTGDDTIIGNGGDDEIFGGEEIDAVQVDGTDGNDTITLSQALNGDLLATVNGVTTTIGNASDYDQILVLGMGGDDTLIIDVESQALVSVPILFDGGADDDELQVIGSPATSVHEVIYQPGPAGGAGELTYESADDAVLMFVQFVGLEPVIDTVPAQVLTVLGTSSSNDIHFTPGSSNDNGLVAIDALETIAFDNKASLVLLGREGDDTLFMNLDEVNSSSIPVMFDGGDDVDGMQISGSPGTPVDDTMYVAGPAQGAGVLTYLSASDTTIASIVFAGLEPIVDLVPAEHLTVVGTSASNTFNYTAGPLGSTGLVAMDDQETIEFAGKSQLVLLGEGGDDVFNIDQQTNPTGLTAITIDAGDGAADALNVALPDAAVNVTLTPSAVDAGTLQLTGVTRVPIAFSSLGIAGTLDITAINADSSVVYDGTDGDDTFSYTANTVALQSSLGAHVPVALHGPHTLSLLSQAGDDVFIVSDSFTTGDLVLDGGTAATADGNRVQLTGGVAEAQSIHIGVDPADALRQLVTGMSAGIHTASIDSLLYTGIDGDDTLTVTRGIDTNPRLAAGDTASRNRLTATGQPAVQFSTLATFELQLIDGDTSGSATFVQHSLAGANAFHVSTTGSGAGDITLAVEGDANDNDLRVTKPVIGSVAVAAIAGGLTITAVDDGIDQLAINLLGGDDFVEVNVEGTAPIAVPIRYDGGVAGDDGMTVVGTPSTGPFDETHYTPGPTIDAGKLQYLYGGSVAMEVVFAGLEPLYDYTGSLSLTVFGTSGPNLIGYGPGPNSGAGNTNSKTNPGGYNTGLVAVDGFETIEFANKASLTLNGLDGDDLVIFTPFTGDGPTGLENPVVILDADTVSEDPAPVTISGTTGADFITIELTGSETAIVSVGDGVNMPIVSFVENATELRIEGNGGDDHITIIAGGNQHRVTHTAGAAGDDGTILTFDQTQLQNLLRVIYSDIGSGGDIYLQSTGAGADTLVLVGSDGADDITAMRDPLDDEVHVTANYDGRSQVGLTAGGFTSFTFDLLAGDDTLTLDLTHGLLATTGQLLVEAGDGDDHVRVEGELTVSLTEYAPHPDGVTLLAAHNLDAGATTTQLMEMTGVEQVRDTVPSSLVVYGTNDADDITYTQTIDSLVPTPIGDADSGGLLINNRTLIAFGQKDALTIDGLGGDDVIQLGGRDLVEGLTQTTLIGDDGDDELFGSAGADTFIPGFGQDIINAQDGDDVVLLEGTEGDDDVQIQPGEVVINGERNTLMGVESIALFTLGGDDDVQIETGLTDRLTGDVAVELGDGDDNINISLNDSAPELFMLLNGGEGHNAITVIGLAGEDDFIDAEPDFITYGQEDDPATVIFPEDFAEGHIFRGERIDAYRDTDTPNRLDFVDADGNEVSVLLKGTQGVADIYRDIANGPNADIDAILIGDTSGLKRGGTSLKIDVKKADGTDNEVSVGGIVSIDGGGLKEIKAPNVDVLQGIEVPGDEGVGKITLDDVSGAIVLGGGDPDAPASVTLKLGDVQDLQLITDTPIGKLTAASWLSTDADLNVLDAPAIRSLRVDGDFEASVELRGLPSMLPSALLLNKAQFRGNVTGGTWNIAGAAGNIKVNGWMRDTMIATTGDVKHVQVGRLEHVDLLLDVTDSFDFESITSATPAEELFDSAATLKKLTVRGIRDEAGTMTRDSRIASWHLGNVTLRDLEADNSGKLWGLAAVDLKSLRVPDENYRWPNRDEANGPDQPWFGDFRVRLVEA